MVKYHTCCSLTTSIDFPGLRAVLRPHSNCLPSSPFMIFMNHHHHHHQRQWLMPCPHHTPRSLSRYSGHNKQLICLTPINLPRGRRVTFRILGCCCHGKLSAVINLLAVWLVNLPGSRSLTSYICLGVALSLTKEHAQLSGMSMSMPSSFT